MLWQWSWVHGQQTPRVNGWMYILTLFLSQGKDIQNNKLCTKHKHYLTLEYINSPTLNRIHHIISYHIISYHIISYHIKYYITQFTVYITIDTNILFEIYTIIRIPSSEHWPSSLEPVPCGFRASYFSLPPCTRYITSWSCRLLYIIIIAWPVYNNSKEVVGSLIISTNKLLRFENYNSAQT